jgi:hypothetical protein
MSRFATNYEIARATGVCAASARPIEVGETYVAALVETGTDEGLVRRDYSMAAWEGGVRPASPESLFGYWTATRPDANAPAKALIEPQEIAELFAQLEGATGEKQIAFRFVLSLILMRKRVIKFVKRGEPAEGRQTMVVRWGLKSAGPGDERMTVIDPGMDEQAVADAMEQIGAVMMGPDEGGGGDGDGNRGGDGGKA